MDNEKLEQLQMLDYQLKQVQKVLETIDSQLIEINTTIEALGDFERLSGENEALFPIANGIFAKGTLSNDKMLRINIGSGTIVEKNIQDTILMMKKQASDIESYKREVESQMQAMLRQMQELQS